MISEAMKREYDELGYLMVGGLIPADVVDRAAQTLVELHEEFGDKQPNFTGANHRGYDHPDLLATYTPQLYAAVALLVGDEPANLIPATCAYSIIGLTVDDPDLVELMHIDWMDRDNHRHPGFRTLVMTFLGDVAPGGGGTFVWPRSGRRVRELVRDQADNYDAVENLQQAIKSRQIEFGNPVETTPRKGDVLFVDSWMVHAGGLNRTKSPRLALNWKW